MPTGDYAFIEEGVLRCVSKRREIQAAYIFGSVASGRTRPGSDVDVAVLLGQKSKRLGAIDYHLKLAAEISSAILRSDVDLLSKRMAAMIGLRNILVHALDWHVATTLSENGSA